MTARSFVICGLLILVPNSCKKIRNYHPDMSGQKREGAQRKFFARSLRLWVFACAFLLYGSGVDIKQSLAQIAVRGETIYTMAGQPIKDGVVLMRDGKIERVDSASQVRIPSGYKVLSAKVVTPGLIRPCRRRPRRHLQSAARSGSARKIRSHSARAAGVGCVQPTRRFGRIGSQPGRDDDANRPGSRCALQRPDDHRQDARRHGGGSVDRFAGHGDLLLRLAGQR